VKPRAVLLLAVLAPAAALGQNQGASKDPGLKLRMSEIELGATHESLNKGLPDWRSIYLEGAHYIADRQTLYGGIRRSERFDKYDTEEWIGYYHPLAPTWTLLFEGSLSEQHQVLPKGSAFAQIAKQLPYAWGLNLGLRRSEYTTSGVTMLVAGAERYWGDWRGAYTLYSGRPDGGPSAEAHRFQLTRYYGERSYIGASYTFGREVENIGPPVGILTSDVRDLTINGRHWLTRDWALSWDLVAHEQGTLYRREGFRLGLRYRF
jgi:YaiO family outer membrane protein